MEYATRVMDIEKQLLFYNTLFESDGKYIKQFTNVAASKCKVIFVFNGADYIEVQRLFVSDSFSSAVVHVPVVLCIQWICRIEFAEMIEAQTQRNNEELAKAVAEKDALIDALKQKKKELEDAINVKLTVLHSPHKHSREDTGEATSE
jgi:hypothetical protein